jgi:hypothetical protein
MLRIADRRGVLALLCHAGTDGEVCSATIAAQIAVNQMLLDTIHPEDSSTPT